MRTILSFSKHLYLKRVSIFLIAVMLIAGVVSCNGAAVQYDLTMAMDPAAGGTATDETGTSPYAEGADVSIKAVANPPYQFVKWMAPAGTFADENAATTTFTMPAEDVTVTANFVGPLDHATVYYVNEASPSYIDEEVYLEDQFGAFHAVVENVEGFAIPAEKMYGDETAPILNPDHCLTLYYISYEEDPGTWVVDIENQFGTQTLWVEGPYGLAVPTQNENHVEPLGLDHYLLYYVYDYTYLDEVYVELNDQFLDEPLVSEVYEPMVFANPVRKTHGTEVTEILNPDVHAVGYMTDWGDVVEAVDVVNQFGEQTLDVDGPYGLVVPSQKTMPEPPGPAFAAVLGDYTSQLTSLLLANNISAVQRGWDVISDISDYDVVVVNEPDDPGETTFQNFLDAASANGVGVVFTSSYSVGSSWGISLLEWYLGDPAGQDEDYDDGDVSYNVTQNHPIFNGWNVTDEITIITGGDCDHAWFWDYSGDTIAEVGSDGGLKGDAVAVSTYGGSTHVLLASLGPQEYTDENDWTDDGRTIFINAVLFAGGI